MNDIYITNIWFSFLMVNSYEFYTLTYSVLTVYSERVYFLSELYLRQTYLTKN